MPCRRSPARMRASVWLICFGVSTLTVGAAAVVAGAVAPFAGCGAVHADCEYGPANPFGLQRKLGCD